MGMRDYGKLSPRFWIGDTGKEIKKRGMAVQILATYLISSPHSTMIGVYYLPMSFISHETGLSIKAAANAMHHLIELDFCTYDEEHEYIWVHNMARFQMAEKLDPKDHLVKNANTSFKAFPKLKFLQRFYDKYKTRYHLNPREGVKCTLEAPSETLSSQEQDQEHEQDQETEEEDEDHAESENDSAYIPSRTGLISILLKNGNEFEITQSQIDEWKVTFPKIDVMQVLKIIKNWNEANPKKRKQKAGILRHINLWLAREHDKFNQSNRNLHSKVTGNLFSLNQTITEEWLQKDSIFHSGDQVNE